MALNNQIKYKEKNLTAAANRAIIVPQNFFESATKPKKDIFGNKFKERRDLEQYFWTSDTVKKLLNACQYMTECCCLTTPSLAEAFRLQYRDEKLLDIDDRFNYMPRFERFDITKPHSPDGVGTFSVIVIDPPFFGITTQQLFEATELVTGGDRTTKIIIAYLVRYEYALLETFRPYGISETSCDLEYAHIKPNKWRNFKLYSNIDLSGIKRKPYKYGYKDFGKK